MSMISKAINLKRVGSKACPLKWREEEI